MKQNEIRISIIMANYNYEKYLSNAIESILNQTYTNWELIIIDDGSKDNSVNIIRKYCEKDSRIKFFQHENAINKGLKNTLLLGLEITSNEWVAFLESDDVLKPNYLEEKVKAIQNNPEAELIFNDIELFGDENEVRGYDNYLLTRQNILNNPKIKYNDLLTVNIISTFSSVMIKKKALLTCDFNSPMPQSLDYYLWTQLYEKIKMIYISEKLTLWRKHAINYMNIASRAKLCEFNLGLLKNLSGSKSNKFLFLVYRLANNIKIEKLCRPQANFISKCISRILLKNKTCELIRI